MDARWMKETPTDTCLDVVTSPPDERRALRRAVKLACDVISHYGDEPEQRMATNVSPLGMWIDTDFPLHPGAEVVVGLRPEEGPELFLFATVCRVVTGRRRGDRGRIGMGLEFRALSDRERTAIARSLEAA